MTDLKQKIEETITRFCYRNGRHGETYLLEKGLTEGLGYQLLSLFTEESKKREEELIARFEEIIGEDEYGYANKPNKQNAEQEIRNYLRDEQHQKLAALKKERDL